MLRVFISGLKKGAGKTVLASGLAGTMQSLSYSTAYYKPIQTGVPPLDQNYVNKIDSNIKTFTSYGFDRSDSPLISSYYSDVKKISLKKIYNDYQNHILTSECNIIEGSNGISTPIDDKLTEIDVVKILNLPLVLTVNMQLDNLEDIILATNYIYSKNVQLLGVVVNNYDHNFTTAEQKYFPELITQFTNAKILGKLPHYDNINSQNPGILIADILNYINLEELFEIKIAKLS